MSVAVAEEPQLLHSVSGRLRVHVPAWEEADGEKLAQSLRRIAGVRRAQVNTVTANALILFDPALTDRETILTECGRIAPSPSAESASPDSSSAQPAAGYGPRVLRAGKGRARVAVRGLDRDPRLARRVVDRLQEYPGVRASANQLTGRVLIEYEEHRADLDALLAEIAGMELPELVGEDRPAHPLDPAPLVQSVGRVAGAATGLGLLAVRHLAGTEGPPVSGSTPAVAAGMIGIVQGFPATRNGLRTLLGQHLADLLFQGAAICSLALSGNLLGLALSGGEALRLLTETTARRAAWQRYGERLPHEAGLPGATIRLEAGDRTPRGAEVFEGTGTAVGRSGLPRRVLPGSHIPAGSRLYGGPFVVTLDVGAPFTPEPRPAPVGPSLYSRYHQALGPASLIYAGLTALLTRSVGRTFAALLLVTPRTAVIGAEAADLSASARVLRAGVTVVGTRPNRPVRRPGLLLLESARTLTDGLEAHTVLPLAADLDAAELLALAAGIAGAARSPWGGAFPRAHLRMATQGSFDGDTASAAIDGEPYTLGPLQEGEATPQTRRLTGRGHLLLAVRADGRGLLGVIALRPRLTTGVADLVAACERHGVELGLMANGGGVAGQVVAHRARIGLLLGDDPVSAIRARQLDGTLVAFAADSADAAAAFAACDLAIGLSSGRSGRFPARADLLAPDLTALAAIIEAGGRREGAVFDAVALSTISNIVGAIWGLRGAPGIEQASRAVYLTALGALVSGWLRLRGGRRSGTSMAHLIDPRPERWGGRSVEEVLRMLTTRPAGLSAADAARRLRPAAHARGRSDLIRAVLDQVRSPMTGVLAVAGGIALAVGSPFDVGIIAATIAVNVAVGAWQERRAGQAAAVLQRMGAATARVIRDGMVVQVPAADVVPGDVLVLASGDQVVADARLIEAHHLEVDEAALTGESLPATKVVDGGADAAQVVLAGSAVTVGTGHAVAVAVGSDTRMGATAAALASDDAQSSPLSERLNRILRQVLPVAAAGGAIVVGSGVLRGRPLLPQLAVGATLALGALPEGLPLLTGVSQAGIAGRLAERKALVRRLAAVEALGRVDVACTDKTGTLTEGRLALTLIAGLDEEATVARGGTIGPALYAVLQAAALASPHPDAADAAAHPTDVAIVEGALQYGLGATIEQERTSVAPFDPVRSFHAAVVGGTLWVKGSTEALLPRCTRVRRGDVDAQIDAELREELQQRAETLSARGLRVLMVAEGTPNGTTTDPRDLTVLGFVGISDPLRADVPAALRRCRAAGIRTIMLTGDHPATARAIARQAGLLRRGDEVLTGVELADLQNGELDQRLEDVSVIARVTPLDKLRIVESLQRAGHTVAMTGDGVNDAPALRLADVGVAMGRGGTEVARQAADVVLADDNFATLVEALVEGRGFWQNMRRALGLLLGGNLGELALVAGASMLGMASPLAARQILAVNLITDALPALAVSLQPPPHRDLARLAREGAGALDTPLRNEVLRRGMLTAVPSLVAFAATLGAEGLPQARTVAFASVVATQLVQTLEAGWAEGGLSRPVVGAVVGSAGLLSAALWIPALRGAMLLTVPSPLCLVLIGGSALAALAASRAIGRAPSTEPILSLGTVPSPRPLRLLPAASLP